MKLYVKEKMVSLKGEFTVQDELENDKYYIKGEFPSISKKFHIYDKNHNEIAFVKENLLSLIGKYEVYIKKELVTVIKVQSKMKVERLYLENLNWKVEGNLRSRAYKVIDELNTEIFKVSKTWFSWGDSYEIDVMNTENEIVGLAIVLVIDCILDSKDTTGGSIKHTIKIGK